MVSEGTENRFINKAQHGCIKISLQLFGGSHHREAHSCSHCQDASSYFSSQIPVLSQNFTSGQGWTQAYLIQPVTFRFCRLCVACYKLQCRLGFPRSNCSVWFSYPLTPTHLSALAVRQCQHTSAVHACRIVRAELNMPAHANAEVYC